MSRKPKAAVDFDAVLHHYDTWDGNRPTRGPVPGVRHGLGSLCDAGYDVFVYSTRDAAYVRDWLAFWELDDMVTRVVDGKAPYSVLFDDRARHVRANEPGGLIASVADYLDERIQRGAPAE